MAQPGHSPLNWVEEALDQFEQPLLRYALRFVGRPELAQEVVQETFVKLCQLDRSTLTVGLGPWLYAVCRNQAIDVRRKESRMSTVIDPTTYEPSGNGHSPEHAAAAKDSGDWVMQQLDRLPEQQQECLRLKFQHGMKYSEIASILGTTANHVGVQVHLGLKTLREKLARHAESER
ncbi:MAG: sigma-70 family RNA polymerase sigma factor [Planctomycetota bacterium]|nr:MAG: sigma-70 family RNA polymerase sigma factor [Planctomycetota bacterium]